jgi:hypothetical protein
MKAFKIFIEIWFLLILLQNLASVRIFSHTGEKVRRVSQCPDVPLPYTSASSLSEPLEACLVTSWICYVEIYTILQGMFCHSLRNIMGKLDNRWVEYFSVKWPYDNKSSSTSTSKLSKDTTTSYLHFHV